MPKGLQTLALLTATGALLAAPGVGQANKPPHDHPTGKGHGNADGKGKGKGKGPANAQRCAKPTVNKGFVVKGTLLAFTPDTTGTAADEESVTLTVTRQNRHARRAELADAQPGTDGLQYKVDGTGPNGDPFDVQLSGFEPNEAPGTGDRVKIVGKVAVTKKKCAEPGASLAERYGAVNVRKVRITEVD